MKCGMLQDLPEQEILTGFIARASKGYVFHWDAFFPNKKEHIKKNLETVSDTPVIEFTGTKDEIRKKIQSLNKKEGLLGVNH